MSENATKADLVDGAQAEPRRLSPEQVIFNRYFEEAITERAQDGVISNEDVYEATLIALAQSHPQETVSELRDQLEQGEGEMYDVIVNGLDMVGRDRVDRDRAERYAADLEQYYLATIPELVSAQTLAQYDEYGPEGPDGIMLRDGQGEPQKAFDAALDGLKDCSPASEAAAGEPSLQTVGDCRASGVQPGR